MTWRTYHATIPLPIRWAIFFVLWMTCLVPAVALMFITFGAFNPLPFGERLQPYTVERQPVCD